ncbi:MAG: hypothetical protein IJ754_04625 [Bacteroidaceae bacterium]|nr:hypothetical protein [Bacteroidaceae bacterium]
MAIRFTIAKRGLLPNERVKPETGASADRQDAQVNGEQLSAEEQEALVNELQLKSLRPRLEHRKTVDAVEFQADEFRLPSMLTKGELLSALDVLTRVMVHEMKMGNAVKLPGLGTFRLSLKGEIEVKQGNYHGKNVHVDGLLFEPDHDLLAKVRDIEVDQVPVGNMFRTEDTEVEQRLEALFSQQETITNQDVYYAFDLLLTRRRVTTLLSRLVREGKLIREGRGGQTRYRQVKA